MMVDVTQEEPKDSAGTNPTEETVIEGGPGGVIEQPPEVEPTVTTEAPQFKPEYRTWEEAERAVKETKKKMTEAAQEAARYRESLKRTQPQAQESPRQRIMREARDKIARIPENDPDREQKAWDIMAEAQEQVAQEVVRQKTAEQEGRTAAQAQALKLIKEKGLSLPFSHPEQGEIDLGERAFWLLTLDSGFPRGAQLDEQTEWLFGQMKMYNDAVIADHEAKKRKPTGPQNLLGKGGKRPPVKTEEDEGPGNLLDEIREVQEKKRYKG
jgi:hypothetical protein